MCYSQAGNFRPTAIAVVDRKTVRRIYIILYPQVPLQIYSLYAGDERRSVTNLQCCRYVRLMLYMYIITIIHCTASSSSTTTKIHCTRRDTIIIIAATEERDRNSTTYYYYFFFLCFIRDPTRAWKLKNRQYFTRTRCG